jgi:hypothetical protein
MIMGMRLLLWLLMRMVMIPGRIWCPCVITFRPGSGVGGGPLLSRLLEPGRRRCIVVRPRSAVPHVGLMVRSGGIARSTAAASSVLCPVMVVHSLLRPSRESRRRTGENVIGHPSNFIVIFRWHDPIRAQMRTPRLGCRSQQADGAACLRGGISAGV